MRSSFFLRIIMIGAFMLGAMISYSQEEDFDELLQRVDTIENPVYKPVLSMSYGALNFIGDVKNSNRMPVVGNPAFQFNVTTFIDNNQYFEANFYFLTGVLTGNQQSVSDLSQNLNFSSNIFAIGATARYSFGHLIPREIWIRPFVSVGVEQLNFNSKGDLFNGEELMYYYWPDGTIRNLPVGATGAALPINRDYIYETDLRSYENDTYGLGDYSPRSVGLPLEVGFTMDLSERIAVSLSTSYHFTFTDFIDNVAYSGTHIPGNRAKDGFFHTMATLHFDMFSDPTTRTVDLLFAEMEMDPIFFEDEDGDFILDLADRCPGTPYGVAVDTVGCPFDEDADGVPDYLDKELDTPPGTWVDDEGVTLSESDFLVSLSRDTALLRVDLDAYLAIIEYKYEEKAVTEIPENFVPLDTDQDGYISFDELLKVVDDYFDFSVDLSLDELRQVNEFFFSQ